MRGGGIRASVGLGGGRSRRRREREVEGGRGEDGRTAMVVAVVWDGVLMDWIVVGLW